MSTRVALITAVLMVVSVDPWAARPGLNAAETQQNPSAQQPAQQPPSNMAAMMKMHEQMMAEMKANDARLAALVKEMNAATGSATIDAVRSVVNELARQHRAMYERMGQMDQQQMMMMGGAGMMRGR